MTNIILSFITFSVLPSYKLKNYISIIIIITIIIT